MGGKKILITVSDEQYKALEKMANKRGLCRVSVLAKSVVLQKVNAPLTDDTQQIELILPNYSELEKYAKLKRFGTVESFAGYAMEAWMARNPLTASQRALVGKSIGKDETDTL